jgi:hypothetical protein
MFKNKDGLLKQNVNYNKQNIEDKLKKLSKDRQPNEIIGEWTTYKEEE